MKKLVKSFVCLTLLLVSVTLSGCVSNYSPTGVDDTRTSVTSLNYELSEALANIGAEGTKLWYNPESPLSIVYRSGDDYQIIKITDASQVKFQYNGEWFAGEASIEEPDVNLTTIPIQIDLNTPLTETGLYSVYWSTDTFQYIDTEGNTENVEPMNYNVNSGDWNFTIGSDFEVNNNIYSFNIADYLTDTQGTPLEIGDYEIASKNVTFGSLFNQAFMLSGDNVSEKLSPYHVLCFGWYNEESGVVYTDSNYEEDQQFKPNMESPVLLNTDNGGGISLGSYTFTHGTNESGDTYQYDCEINAQEAEGKVFSYWTVETYNLDTMSPIEDVTSQYMSDPTAISFIFDNADAPMGNLEYPIMITAHYVDAAVVRFISEDKEISSQNVIIGDTAIIPDSPVKEGYDFIGWFTEDGVQVTDFSNITESLTVYATYKVKETQPETTTVANNDSETTVAQTTTVVQTSAVQSTTQVLQEPTTQSTPATGDAPLYPWLIAITGSLGILIFMNKK